MQTQRQNETLEQRQNYSDARETSEPSEFERLLDRSVISRSDFEELLQWEGEYSPSLLNEVTVLREWSKPHKPHIQPKLTKVYVRNKKLYVGNYGPEYDVNGKPTGSMLDRRGRTKTKYIDTTNMRLVICSCCKRADCIYSHYV